MDAKLIVLKLFLDELETPTSIDTIDDRKRVQKAVYLGQLSGIDLGYRFGWYLKGPYSPSLTRDYYSLAEAIAADERDYECKELSKAVRDNLHKILPLMNVPEGVALSQEDWLELVASVHYLRNISKFSREKMQEVLEAEKLSLKPYAESAETELRKARLLD